MNGTETQEGVLTLEAMQTDPVAALELRWPHDADQALCEMAIATASRIAKDSYRNMQLTRLGVIETATVPGDPDMHEWHEAIWLQADTRVREAEAMLNVLRQGAAP